MAPKIMIIFSFKNRPYCFSTVRAVIIFKKGFKNLGSNSQVKNLKNVYFTTVLKLKIINNLRSEHYFHSKKNVYFQGIFEWLKRGKCVRKSQVQEDKESQGDRVEGTRRAMGEGREAGGIDLSQVQAQSIPLPLTLTLTVLAPLRIRESES